MSPASGDRFELIVFSQWVVAMVVGEKEEEKDRR